MTDKYSGNDNDKDKDRKQNDQTDQSDPSKNIPDPNRRRFLKNSGMVAGGVVGGSLLGGFLTGQLTTTKNRETKSEQENTAQFQQARQFFHRKEDFNVLQAATERIFPKDDNGPGAIELGVPYFIDKQLAGIWGVNGDDYRHGPFTTSKGKKGFNPDAMGDQSILDRGQIFLVGLRKMNKESNDRFDTTFDKADEDQQIEILKDLEDDEISLKGIAAVDFFALLRQATLEGAYADPLYGGNKNMEGWKMKGFPGAQPSYANIIGDEEFQEIEPISLNEYQGD